MCEYKRSTYKARLTAEHDGTIIRRTGGHSLAQSPGGTGAVTTILRNQSVIDMSCFIERLAVFQVRRRRRELTERVRSQPPATN